MPDRMLVLVKKSAETAYSVERNEGQRHMLMTRSADQETGAQN